MSFNYIDFNLEEMVANGIKEKGYKDFFKLMVKSEMFAIIVRDVIEKNHPEYLEYYDRMVLLK